MCTTVVYRTRDERVYDDVAIRRASVLARQTQMENMTLFLVMSKVFPLETSSGTFIVALAGDSTMSRFFAIAYGTNSKKIPAGAGAERAGFV